MVHGLFRHPKNTWTSNTATKETSSDRSGADEVRNENEQPAHKTARTSLEEVPREVYWPRDLLPRIFPQARITTWGYDVRIEQMLSSASQASIFHHSETLLSDLAMLRSSALDQAKPIIFIAHSLGGIVVKDALSMSSNERTFFHEISPATMGVMFLGTPHHGTKIASLGKMAFELSRLLFQKPNIKVLRGLEADSEILERITRSFGQILASGRIQIHSFREELDTNGIRIVDAFSSIIGYQNETRGNLYANHKLEIWPSSRQSMMSNFKE